MKVSICIPTWEQHGNGHLFLYQALETIKQQTYTNYEIIISDHSKNDEIEKLCLNYPSIKYLRNNKDHGNSPANTNNCIKNASGDIIKILFQDDFFFSVDTLKKIVDEFNTTNCSWLVTGCNHTYDNGISFVNYMIPKWNENLVFGVNTISSPSVLAFKKESSCLFDENLVMLMDCEMYYQLYKQYGLPNIVADCLVTNRMHQHQISSMYDKNLEDEVNYIKTKYNLK